VARIGARKGAGNNRVLRVMQHTRWSAEARSQVRLEDAVVAAGVRERKGSSYSPCQNCARTIGHYWIQRAHSLSGRPGKDLRLLPMVSDSAPWCLPF
jgi:hypothetical protein